MPRVIIISLSVTRTNTYEVLGVSNSNNKTLILARMESSYDKHDTVSRFIVLCGRLLVPTQ